MSDDPTSLDRLHDVVAPPPAPWWPLTPGWQIVAIVVGVILVVVLARAFRRWQANRYRREALKLLNPGVTPDHELDALLKRVALSAWPRERVASLSGGTWLAFLDRSGRTTDFTTGPGRALEPLAYDARRTPNPEESEALRTSVRRWIRQHQVAEEETP